jgi:hypothetical protein
MIRLIICILIIIIISSIVGIDELSCGYGPTIRENVKSLFQQEKSPDTMKEKRDGLQK